MFTPKFRKKNARTRSFQDCVIKESIRSESVSADLDVMSESAILWMTSVDNINGLRMDDVREKNIGLYKKEKDWSPSYLKLAIFSFIPKIVISHT